MDFQQSPCFKPSRLLHAQFTIRLTSVHSQEASIWQFILSWYPHRNDDNVLFLHYEDMLQDLSYIVKLVSEFLQLGNEDQELQVRLGLLAPASFAAWYRQLVALGICSLALTTRD